MRGGRYIYKCWGESRGERGETRYIWGENWGARGETKRGWGETRPTLSERVTDIKTRTVKNDLVRCQS
jgi:hypothetical protein